MILSPKKMRVFYTVFVLWACFCIQALASLQESVLFVKASTGKVLHEKNMDVALIPASVSKLFTAACALKTFGANYNFETKFLYTGEKKNGIIYGDLIVKGGGDPLLLSEDLWKIAADLKNLGLLKVKGRLIIDSSLFNSSKNEANKSKSNVAYDAPVSSIAINFNAYSLSIAPADQEGQLARVSFDPYPLADVFIKNEVKTAASSQKEFLHIERISYKNKEEILVKGNIAKGSALKKKYVSTSKSDFFVAQHIRSFLKEVGINIEGTNDYAHSFKNTKVLLRYRGKTLSEIIKSLNHYSNNFIADLLIENIGFSWQEAVSKKIKSSVSKLGLEQVRSFMVKDLFIKSPFVFNSGSGLDISNRLSAKQIVSLLSYMYEDQSLFFDFVNSLPKSAASGTLFTRFRDDKAKFFQNIVRAKTGTLTQPFLVSSLAGYISHHKHGLVFFAMVQNQDRHKKKYSTKTLQSYQEKYIDRVFKSI